MAILRLENGTTYTQLADISLELAKLNVTLNYWPIENEATRQLLKQASLTDEEKEIVLTSLDGYFEQLKQEAGYQARDLIV
ncbi:MAG: acireductone dioxygenase, partial [Chroococcales cyanobacterium metabat2.561]